MSSFIIKLQRGDDAWYLEWSTVSDTPACYGMPLDELREWSLKKYGTSGMWDWDERVKRIEATGTSLQFQFSPETPETAVNCNVCGPEGEELTYDQIIDKYCVGRPKPRVPKPVDHTHAVEQLRLLIEHDFKYRHGDQQIAGWHYAGRRALEPVVSKHWWDHESRRLGIARLRSYIGAVKLLEKGAGTP